ncbi:MAG: phosphatase PAP2 family protein [Actinomycetota bacterium]
MRFPMPVLSIMSLAVVVLIFMDLSFGGLMIEVDLLVNRLAGPFVSPYDYPVADWLDRLGQATIAGIPLLVVSVLVARRLGSVRPFVLAWGSWAVMYGFVGLVKLVTLRESPRTGGPAMFESGTLFPSGHTSNVVFMFGLTTVLLIRYVGVTRWQRTMLTATVPLAFLFMSAVSIYRHTHWLTDIVVGGLIGVIALELCVRCDTCWPTVRRRLQRMSGRHHAVTERSVQRLRNVILAHPVPNGSAVPDGALTESRPPRYPYRATAPRASSPAPTTHATAAGATSAPTPEPPRPDGDRASGRSRRG